MTGRAPHEVVFGLDTRSLSLFRVGLGLLVVVDALDRLRDLTAHYSDAGALPRDLVRLAGLRPSLLMWSGEAWWSGLWLLLAAAAGLAIALGWRTRLATAAAWVIVVSVQARNPMVLYGSDTLLRTMLMWSLFLPLAAHWSLDRAAGRAPGSGVVVSGASAAWVVQIAVLYLVTWVLKDGPTWADGTAGWFTFQVDHFTGPLGRQMLAWPELLRWGTHATMALELVGPLLLFVPLANVRMAVVVAFVGFHACLGLTMAIGWWPVTSIVCWVPLIPGEVWERAGWPVRQRRLGLARPADAALAVMGAMVLWWNVATVYPRSVPVTGLVRRVAMALRLDQNWNMYAPEPLTDDGWFVVDAVMPDGRRLDLLRGGEERSWRKPSDVSSHYGTLRWRKAMRAMWMRTSSEQRAPYLRWMCEQHLEAGGERPDKVVLWYMLEESVPPGAEPPKVRRVRLAEGGC